MIYVKYVCIYTTHFSFLVPIAQALLSPELDGVVYQMSEDYIFSPDTLKRSLLLIDTNIRSFCIEEVMTQRVFNSLTS